MDSIGCQFIVDTIIADPDSINLSASVVDVLLGGDGEIDFAEFIKHFTDILDNMQFQK